MLWLCLHFPRLPATALGLEHAHEAVTERRGPKRWLVTEALGFAIGTPLSSALNISPELVAHARKPAAERRQLQQLAIGAWRYGSPVAMELVEAEEEGRAPRALVWVEIGASLRLFGGIKPLLSRVRRELQADGHALQFAVAPTRAAAALLALGERPVICREASELPERLAPLPLARLGWPQGLLDSLHGVGLRQLGELFAIDRSAFARRFGEARLHELDRLLGRAPEPFRAVTPPLQFRRRFQMLGEIETVEGVLFPLRRLCGELATYLAVRGLGAEGVNLDCLHAQARPTTLALRFVAPVREAAALFDNLRERLTRCPPTAPVTELRLQAKDFSTPPPLQTDLFDDAGGRALEWQRTLDRIAARLGDGCLWTPAIADDHRPEAAWTRQPPGQGSPAAEPRARPLWLLPSPEKISPPQIESQPERIEGGWWSGADAMRDYHSVPLDEARAWVYRDRRDGAWYLHGWWA